ncbi:MAG: S41 family peptidase, partial [Balneolaceae bacterium]|nr:S41 family peptidase [Balneolaceae bacterium]
GVKVVETRGRLSEHNNEFRTSEPVLAGDLSLVILQNGGSASASEIVAGALQDLDRAVIVGERSFGKGLVQIVRPLSYNTALKITTSRYYIPSGRSIQSVTYTHDEENTQMNRPDSLRKAFKTKNGRTVYDGKGIAPDIEVLEPKPTLLETALLQNSHFFFFANQYVANHQNYEANRVSDQLYSDFKSYLESKDFDFETAPERYLGKMKESLVSGEPSGDLAGHLSQIEQVIEQEKEKAFSSQQEQLKRTLFLELVTRYKGISGRYAASAQFDPVIREAIKVISQPERYQDILAMKN